MGHRHSHHGRLGDIVPKTTTGRWVAVVIMITGIAVLGLLRAPWRFLRLGNGKPSARSAPADEAERAAAAASDAALQALAAEVSALRHQMETLTARLTGHSPPWLRREPEATGTHRITADPA